MDQEVVEEGPGAAGLPRITPLEEGDPTETAEETDTKGMLWLD